MNKRDKIVVSWTAFWAILLVLLLFTDTAKAELRLNIPIYTHHISAPDGLNNSKGLLLEYKDKSGFLFGGGIVKNSIYNTSNTVYIGYEWKYLTASVVSADGYGNISEYYEGKTNTDSIIFYPMFGIKYKYFRLLTSYPFGKETTNQKFKYRTDIVHFQLVIPIN